MRNDPFHPPLSALARDRGHDSVPARPKQPWLFKPLGPTGVPLGGLGTGTIRFGQGRTWHRAYTEHWGSSGQSAGALADHALASADDWLRRIETWQASQAALLGDAPHRAGMAINESYFLTEGLTVLTRPDADGRAQFGLIECHDYALYNTMDLWVYAAEAVARWFPELAAGVAAEFARHTLADDCRPRRHR